MIAVTLSCNELASEREHAPSVARVDKAVGRLLGEEDDVADVQPGGHRAAYRPKAVRSFAPSYSGFFKMVFMIILNFFHLKLQGDRGDKRLGIVDFILEAPQPCPTGVPFLTVHRIWQTVEHHIQSQQNLVFNLHCHHVFRGPLTYDVRTEGKRRGRGP